MVMGRKRKRRRRKREREIESTPSPPPPQHTPCSTFLDLTSEYEALREPESEISHTPQTTCKPVCMIQTPQTGPSFRGLAASLSGLWPSAHLAPQVFLITSYGGLLSSIGSVSPAACRRLSCDVISQTFTTTGNISSASEEWTMLGKLLLAVSS